jgi:hypothetical protein
LFYSDFGILSKGMVFVFQLGFHPAAHLPCTNQLVGSISKLRKDDQMSLTSSNFRLQITKLDNCHSVA